MKELILHTRPLNPLDVQSRWRCSSLLAVNNEHSHRQSDDLASEDWRFSAYTRVCTRTLYPG